MSKSAFVCSLRGNGIQLYFSVARLPDFGRVPDVAVVEEEELKDPGVDNNRYREIYAQFPVFQMETAVDWASRADGDTITQNHFKLQRRVVQMTITLQGVTKNYKKVKIRKVTPRQVAGKMVGFGADANSVGVTYGLWELQVVEV